jgi:two-component system invasion response regulator UvrY
MKKILLVDDHFVVRSGMKAVLSEMLKPIEIHDAGNGDAVVEKLKKTTYDLIIMDIKMPDTDTLGLMEYIATKYPEAKVLIFSMNSENIYAKRFLKMGAKGFISKNALLEDIIKAINTVLNGRKYISESLAQSLAEESISDTHTNPFDKLSKREFEIVSLLVSGQTLNEIAICLNLHSSTVGSHKARIFEKLGVANILELKELANSYKME